MSDISSDGPAPAPAGRRPDTFRALMDALSSMDPAGARLAARMEQVKRVVEQEEAAAARHPKMSPGVPPCPKMSHSVPPAHIKSDQTNPPRPAGAGPTPDPNPLPPRQVLAARLLVMGRPVRAVAAQVGVNRRTLSRWQNDARFAVEVRRQAAQIAPQPRPVRR